MLKKGPPSKKDEPYAGDARLIHELLTHQIELELQNEELRAAELQLAESQKKFQDLYDFAPVGYVSIDERGVIIEANLTFATMCGVERGKLIMTPFYRHLTRDTSDTFYLHHKQVVETGKLQTCEIKCVRKDGTSFYASLRSVLSNGETTRIAISDITERRRTEAIIAADLTALTRMHDLSDMIVEEGGSQRVLQEILDAAVTIMKAEKGTLHLLDGDSLRIAAHHGHQQPFLKFVASAENRVCVCVESIKCGKRVVVPDIETSSLFAGTPSLDVLRRAGVRAEQSTPLVSRTGKQLGILTTQWGAPHNPVEQDLLRLDLLARQASDLIEFVETKKELRESEERLHLFIEHAPAALAMFDREMRYLSSSRRWLDVFKLGERDLRGLSHYDVFPETSSRLKKVHQHGLSGKVIRLEEDRFKRQDGYVQWLRWEVRPWFRGASKVGGIVIFAEDITTRKKAEDALKLNNAELRSTEEKLLKANKQLSSQAKELSKRREHLSEAVEKRTVELKDTIARLKVEIAQHKKTEGFLRESDRLNRHLSSQVLAAQEVERRRISMELHDALGQSLSGIKLYIRAMESSLREDQSAAREECERLMKYIDQVIEDVRRLSLDLSPSVLDELGVTSAIRWLVTNLKKTSAVNVESDICVIDDLVPESQWIVVYRVLQEAINNIIKHAHARNVSVRIRRQDKRVIFTVEDDGKGFDAGKKAKGGYAKGLGLVTMNDRVRMIGGSFDLWSQKDEGTRLTFSIPIEQKRSVK